MQLDLYYQHSPTIPVKTFNLTEANITADLLCLLDALARNSRYVLVTAEAEKRTDFENDLLVWFATDSNHPLKDFKRKLETIRRDEVLTRLTMLSVWREHEIRAVERNKLPCLKCALNDYRDRL
jgi:hypothetical protein